MQFIDKLNPANEKAGCDEIQSVIDSHWIEEESRYRNLDYNNAKSQLGKFTEIIVGEQHELCCYCMRRLYTDASQNGNHKSNITLEHIIPNKISESQWLKERDRYMRFPNFAPGKTTVFTGGKLPDNSKKITSLPHPHFLSYHNLAASCDGLVLTDDLKDLAKGRCCNNRRGNKFVLPLYLIEDIQDKLDYDKEGKLDFDDDDFDERWFGNNCLNLTCSSMNLFRKFWHDLSLSEYTPEDVAKAETVKDLRQDITDDLGCKFGELDDDVWRLLSEYSWFYSYYKSRHKQQTM